MKGLKNTMISLVVFGCLIFATFVHAGGNETKVGGGECVTQEDCSFNGICEDEGKETKKCYCNVKFTGKNCEATATGTRPGKIVKPTKNSKSTFEVKGLEEETGKTRHHVHHRWSTEAGKRRTLDYDPGSNVAGINPASFVDDPNVPNPPQPFLIYSPKTKQYLFMSKDRKVFGKRNYYLEARSNRDGERNKFIVQKAGAQVPQQYYIKNVQTNKYLYVSNSKKGFVGFRSNNVLGSIEDPTGADMNDARKEKFKFEFEEANDGFYKIKGNDNKYLFVSRDRLGIPSNRVVEADTRNRRQAETQLFQFTLYEKAEIKIAYPDNKKQDIPTPNIVGANEYFQNRGAEPLVSHPTFERLFETVLTFSKTAGFSVNADLTAVIPFIGTSIKFDASFTDTKSQKIMNKIVNTWDITTPPDKKTCFTVLLDCHNFNQGFELTAKTKEQNDLKATGTVEGNYHTNVHADVYDINIGEKCAFEP